MEIGVVLVTFNRLNELTRSVRLYEQQTIKPSFILVVDNHSTDGTNDFLNQWVMEDSCIEHRLITLPENTGGSGGFYVGTKEAVKLNADWIWLADDDAYPEPDAFEKLLKFIDKESIPYEEIAALTSAVCSENGYSYCHRSRYAIRWLWPTRKHVDHEEYYKEFFEIDYYSFVGTLIKKEVLIKAGLPRKDFFIYHDDYEHAERVRKIGKILCIPTSRVYHKDNSNASRKAVWRDYYDNRNLLITYKDHFGKTAFCLKATVQLLRAFKSLNPQKIRLVYTAVKDADKGVGGLHNLYRPGWNSKK